VTAHGGVPNSSAAGEPRRSWRRRLGAALAVALIIPCVWYAADYVRHASGDLRTLSADDLPAIALLLSSLFAVMLTNGLVLRDLIGKFGVPLELKAWLGVTLVASMLNLVSPVKGGAAVRALYFKKVHGVAYSSFASVLGASLFCSLAVSAGLATAALLALGVPGGRFGWTALGASALLMASLTLLMSLPAWSGGKSAWLRSRLVSLVRPWNAISADRALVARLLGWSVVGTAFHAIAFVAAFQLAGFAGHWLVPATSSAFARIGALIAITPAGLGIYEAFGAVSAQVIGAQAGPAVLSVLIVRIASTAISLVGGLAFMPMLARATLPDARAAASRPPSL
jgi:uncharacterized membrane protein YbhN (UPF0104 family)